MKLINHLLSLISDHSLIPHDTPTVNWFGPLSPQCCYRLSFPSPCDNKFSFFLFSFFFQFSVFERKEEEKKKRNHPGDMWQPISNSSIINK